MRNGKVIAKSIIATFIVFNPVLLLVMSKSAWFTMMVTIMSTTIGFILFRIEGHTRLKVWMANIAIIIGISLYSELLFRELCPQLNIPNIYDVHGKFYFNKPCLTQTFKDDEFISLYKTNCQGYRIDKLSSPEEKVDSCDWLFIGDSYTQGAQVDYDKLFSTLLYKDFPNKVIVNAGMSGAGLYEELNYYKSMGHRLKPRRVILQIGSFNDFYNVRERSAGFSEYLMDYSDLYRFIEYNIIDNPTLPLGRWTEPFFPDKQSNIDFNIFYKESSERKEQDIDAINAVLKEFKLNVENSGAELVVMLLPSKEQVSRVLLDEVMQRYGIKDNELDMQFPNKQIAKICTENDIRLIDLYDDFTNAEYSPFFERDEHLNEYGHELIAQSLSKCFMNEAHKYDYFSQNNKYERYPTICDDGLSLLYQCQDESRHYIMTSNMIRSRNDVIWQSTQELIHPIISPDGKYLVFTEGDQDNGDTNVILYNLQSSKSCKINTDKNKGAIATFSHDSKYIVYPKWTETNMVPMISLYDIAHKIEITTFGDGAECWRPIFSQDDKLIYYIQKDNITNKFVIREYDIATKMSSLVLKTGYEIWDISLSPSGKYLAYAGNKNGNWDIFVYNINTKRTTQITNTIGDEWDPSFGVTDTELWFAGVFGFNNGIYRVDLDL